MQKNKREIFRRSLCIVCLVFSLFAVVGGHMNAAAGEACISEISIVSGADSRTKLESAGYTVLFQGMNLFSEGGSTVTLGYKKGGSAITGLVVSEKYADSITYNGCTFFLVSGTSLNDGTSGDPIYLYYTKDSAAGNGITSLDTVSGFTDREEVVSLRNDGSSPVLADDGTLANLDRGISNSELYLLVYRSGKIRRYIAEAYIIKGSTKAEAINSAASKGCDYYLDYDMSESDEISYIAYRRTADKSEAITKISISGSELSFEKDGGSGAYLIDISNYKLFAKAFELGDWAGIYAVYDKTVSKSSDEYRALSKSTERGSCVLAGDMGIYAVYEGTVEGSIEEPAEPEQTSSSAVGNETDEFYNIDKSTDTSGRETSADDAGKSAASVISGGNVIAIICFSAVIVTALVCVSIVGKRKSKSDGDGKNKK